MTAVDLNCDMGEGFGAWKMGNDAEMMGYVSSINVACGFHAGDASTIRKTIELAVKNGVAIGAHPSFPDLQGFGRREMSLSNEDIFDIVVYQVSAVKGICEVLGTNLNHVKPHGALYNQAAKDSRVARAIANAVCAVDRDLMFYGLSGSEMIKEAESAGLRTASEVFSDRTYRKDGSLTPRTESNALIRNSKEAVLQVMQMVADSSVTATTGETIPIKADTICIHGDGENAVQFAKLINESLVQTGIRIKSK